MSATDWASSPISSRRDGKRGDGDASAAIGPSRNRQSQRCIEESERDAGKQPQLRIAQLQIALDADAALILLDNFSLRELREAVKLNQGRAILEASGGIDLGNVRDVALTGVDRISIGNLTKNLKAIDLSMRFKTT